MMCLALGLMVSLLAGATRDRFLGDWLEGVRTSTFVTHAEQSGVRVTRPTGRIDDDENALAAYNEMLARLRAGHEESGRD
jgi:hypothetical protein